MASGTHLCSLPGTYREQFAIAVPFLRAGVQAGERCLFVAHDNAVEVVREELSRHGLQASAVAVVPSNATPLRSDSINAGSLLRAWRAATEEALREGFSGLRVVVEMTWALAARVEELAEYEEQAAQLFSTAPIHALCQYNRTRFPEATLRRAATAVHPGLLLEGGQLAEGLPTDIGVARGWHS